MTENQTNDIDSVLFAKYLVAKANAENVDMNLTKLMKLMYICYGVYLAVCQRRLLNERPQAWPYGPVFANARQVMKDVIFYSITEDAAQTLVGNEELNSLIASVFKVFGDWTASELTAWSHSENSPWQKTIHKIGFSFGDVMSDNLVYEYFSTMLSRPKQTEFAAVPAMVEAPIK